jgi:acylphosphatase
MIAQAVRSLRDVGAGPGDGFMVRAVRVIVTGSVQGVGYRAWVEREAETRRLSGWVRNRRDGAVEAVLSGDATVVGAMIEACRSGPRMAAVENVAVEDVSPDHDLQGFRTIATA